MKESKLQVNGSTEFMGIQLPIIEGGFGEDKKCILAKDIAEIHGKELFNINRDINTLITRNRVKEGVHYINLLNSPHEFRDIIENMNLKGSNRTKDIFILSERGYSSLIKYMDDDKSWEVHDELIDSYFQLREQVRNLVDEQDMAILRIVNSKSDIEQALAIKNFQHMLVAPLEETIDRYSRFLCDELSTLTKSGLASKLDTKPQTLAALFKKVGIYTSTSQVKVEFLRKFPNIKMIVETENEFTDTKGNARKTKDWQWTGEGAKELVDYLIELEKVIFTENKGFKLVI